MPGGPAELAFFADISWLYRLLDMVKDSLYRLD